MAIIDTAKEIYELAKKGMTIDLQERLMQIREQALELQEENLSLRTKLNEIEERLSKKENLVFNGEVYFFKEGNNFGDGPFCPTCHDKDGKVVRLHRNRHDDIDATHHCNVCQSFFKN